MNIKEKIQELNEYFKLKFSDKAEETDQVEETRQEFSIIVLKNGEKISVDSLEIGNVVSKIVDNLAEDIEAGEYELEDGTIVVVGEDGKISDIKKPEEPSEEEMVDEGTVDDKIVAIITAIEKLQENINVLANTLTNEVLPYITKTDEEMKEQAEVISSKFNEFKTEVESKFKMIEDKPFGTPQHFKDDRKEINKNLSRSELARLKMLDELNNKK